jgi:hypothetical protein
MEERRELIFWSSATHPWSSRVGLRSMGCFCLTTIPNLVSSGSRQTRKIYFDERRRIERSHREFAESLSRGR